MEEKVLVKGTFGGKFVVALIYILAAMFGIIFIWIGIADENEEMIIPGVFITIVFVIIGIIVSAILKKREFIITNKRVIARGAFGFWADMPLEKVTAIRTGFFSCIGCSTPSVKVKYHFCKNKMEIFDTITAEVLQRDSKYQ